MIEFDLNIEMKGRSGQSTRDQQALRRWESNVGLISPFNDNVHRLPKNPVQPGVTPQPPTTTNKSGSGGGSGQTKNSNG